MSNYVNAQTTAIPDANFEQALIDLGHDTGVPDGTVPTANINSVTALDVSSKSISDLTGIEDFTALTYLDCNNNQLTGLDVSQNTNLTYLDSDNNNGIGALNVTQNTQLIHLQCTFNQLTTLDVSQNTSLTYLYCGFNSLTVLDVSQNPALTYLNCAPSSLAYLDVSQNVNLVELLCYATQITCLNVKNGNNVNFTTFQASGNSNLTCIEVDDVMYSTTNWTNIDVGVAFSVDCNNACSPVGVGISESNLAAISAYPNPTKGTISIDLGEVQTNLTATLTNILGQEVHSQKIESTDHFTMDIHAPSGVYFLRLETASGESNIIKVVKE